MVKKAKSAHVVVGTIGSLVGMCKSNQLRLTRCRFFIIDEADRCCSKNYGSPKDVQALWSRCPKIVQTMLFSATLHSGEIRKCADTMCKHPTWVDLKGRDYVPDTVNHSIVMIDPSMDASWTKRVDGLKTDGVHLKDNVNPRGKMSKETISEGIKRLKLLLLKDVIDAFQMEMALIFCRTRVDCDNCFQFLTSLGGGRKFLIKGQGGKENPYSCLPLHSGISQHDRHNNLKNFKEGDVRFLICTDVAARGIDIKDLPYVI
eukprot:UN33818